MCGGRRDAVTFESLKGLPFTCLVQLIPSMLFKMWLLPVLLLVPFVIGQQGGYLPPRNTVTIILTLTAADCRIVDGFIPNTVEDVDQHAVTVALLRN